MMHGMMGTDQLSEGYLKERRMKKKLLLAAVFCALVLAPVSAKSLKTTIKEHTYTDADFNLGLEVGTTEGISAKYVVNKKLTMAGSVGFNVLNDKTIDISAYSMTELYAFELDDRDDLHVFGGVGGIANIASDGNTFALTPLANLGLEWGLNDNMPIDFYFRVFPGYRIVFNNDSSMKSQVVVGACLGAYWRFI
jgi:hypothetical protein